MGIKRRTLLLIILLLSNYQTIELQCCKSSKINPNYIDIS